MGGRTEVLGFAVMYKLKESKKVVTEFVNFLLLSPRTSSFSMSWSFLGLGSETEMTSQ